MDFRSAALLVAFLSLGGHCLAQTEQPAQEPAPSATGTTAGTTTGQDPDRPSKTPAERIAELKREQERLQREIKFVRERVAKSRDTLQEKLANREMQYQAIDAGTNSVAPMLNSPTRKPAELLTDTEVKAFGDDALLLVEGRPIRQGAVEALKSYLTDIGSAPNDDIINQRSMLELVRIEAVIGSFPESAAEAMKQMQDAQRELGEGKDFLDVVMKYSRGPLVQDAKLTITRNCPFGLLVEKAVFDTPEGKTTEIVTGQNGFVMVKVDKHNKGENRIQDTVEGRILVIPYHPDPSEVQQVHSRIALGQVSLRLRDKGVINMLPVMMRPSSVGSDGQKDAIEQMQPRKDAPMPIAPKKGGDGKGTGQKGSDQR